LLVFLAHWRDILVQDIFGQVLLPKTEDNFYFSAVVLTAVHLLVGYAIEIATRREWPDTGLIITRVFDASTFAGSTLLLIGIFVPSVLKAIGSVKPFLLFASFIGVIYSIHALKPRR
jgi:uncharacterized membrane protein